MKCPIGKNGDVCSGRGKCEGAGDTKGKGGCKCDYNYKGVFCDECKNNDPWATCGFGECINTPGSYACKCKPGYVYKGMAFGKSLCKKFEVNGQIIWLKKAKTDRFELISVFFVRPFFIIDITVDNLGKYSNIIYLK